MIRGYAPRNSFPLRRGDVMTLRRIIAVSSVLGAGVLIWASAAWACTSIASLNLSSASGNAGDTVHLNGSSFSPNPGPIQSVVLHWNGISGAVLATVTPDATGTISGDIQIPQAPPGVYVVVATQNDGMGGQAFGTPARAGFQILGPSASQTARPALAPIGGSIPTGSSTSVGLIALTVALGVAGFALFGVGAGAFARHTRRRPVPSRESVKKS
jgi:hypothetical protein